MERIVGSIRIIHVMCFDYEKYGSKPRHTLINTLVGKISTKTHIESLRKVYVMTKTKEGPTKTGHREGLAYFIVDKLLKKDVYDTLSEFFIGI